MVAQMLPMHKGFSLIEVLVVIAVVAIIVTIAVPSIRAYYARSYFSMAMTSIDHINDQAKIYHSANGVFPTAANLNMSGVVQTNYDQVDEFASYFDFVPSGECFVTSYYINTNYLGLGSDAVSEGGDYTALINTATAEVDGVLETRCQYMIIGPSGMINNEYIPDSLCERVGISGAPSFAAFDSAYCS